MIVLGTHNPKKAIELQEWLQPTGIQVCTLADFDNAIDVVEDGNTFQANATKKATQQARQLKRWVVGEDSGLCIDALNGEPGVFSARISGPHATDQSNNEYVLEKMKGVPREKRTAHYVCHMTLSDPDGMVRIDCEAICRGLLRHSPVGSHGFGYDPLFEIKELHRTFGELGSHVKRILSHRGRAIRQFVRHPVLKQVPRD